MDATSRNPARWLQFSLWSLFVLIAFFAVGLTALKFACHAWSVAITTATVTLLLFAILQAVHGRDTVRAFWSGFAICGCGYVAVLLYWPVDRYGTMGEELITDEALRYLFMKFNPESEESGGPGPGWNGLGGGAAFDVPDPSAGDPPADPFGSSDTWSTPAPVPVPTIQPAPNPSQEAEELLEIRRTYFPRIGHGLFVILIGWLGGWIAAGISRSKRQEVKPISQPDAASP